MNFKRKLVTGLLGLAALCGCLGACIFSNSNIYATEVNAVSEEHDHIDWTPISSLPTTSGNYYLISNIAVSSPWMAPQGTTNLCLNGYLITSSSNNIFSVIGIGDGDNDKVELNIYDCENTEHYFIYDGSKYYGQYLESPTDEQIKKAKTLDEFTGTISNGSIIKLLGGCITNGNKTNGGVGGGIAVSGKNAKLTLYSGNIVGNRCNSHGGGVSIADGGTFTMEGGLVSLNNAINSNLVNGGGVFLDNGSFTMKSGIISYNYSSKYGGGVYVNSNATMVMNNGNIKNNIALHWGGGVHNNGTFTMSDGSILNNTVLSSGGGGINSDGTTLIIGGTITGNHCNGTGSNGAHQIRKGNGTTTVKDYCTIDCGSNDLWGVTIDQGKSRILFDKQGGEGGWDNNDQQCPFVSMDVADPLSSLVPTRSGYTFLGYFDAPTGGTKYYNPNGSSAANWNRMVKEITLYAQWEKNHTHDNLTYEKWTSTNSLPTSPGNYYLTSNVTLDSPWMAPVGTTNLCLNGYFITTNTGNEYSVIGVGYGDNKEVNLNISECNFSDRYYSYNSTYNLFLKPIFQPSQSDISKAKSFDSITNLNNLVTGDVVKIPGGAICGGYKSKGTGGAISVNGSKAKLTLSNGNIVGNYCTSYGGGVVVQQYGSFVMNGGNIVGNKSDYDGGGVSVQDNGTFTLNDGKICLNQGNYGGGIVVRSNARFEMFDGFVSSNKATGSDGNGGGIRVNEQGEAIIEGGEISYNEAKVGGGLYNMNKTTIKGGTFTNNNANGTNDTGNGGAIYSLGTLNIEGGEIKNNTSAYRGAAVYNYGTFNLSGGSITNNTCVGGAIFNDANKLFTMTGGEIKNNSATYGGGLLNIGTIVISGGTLIDNTSVNPGNQIRALGGTTTIKDYVRIDNGDHDLNLNDGYITLGTLKTHVYLDKQDGTSDTMVVDATYGANMPTITIPTRKGYTFGGYFTGINGTGTKYYNADGSSVGNWDFKYLNSSKFSKYFADITLYAYWTANSYTVSLDTQSGTGGSTSITPTFDTEMPEITLPTRDYCGFGGYFTETNGKGTQYYNADGTSTRNWDVDSNTTLYAYWTITLENFSTQFIKLTDGFCDNDGKIEESTKSTLKASFDLLSDADKQTFKSTVPQTGRTDWTDSDDEIVVNAKSRYCYLISDWKCNDFLNLFTESELKALMHRGSIVSLFNNGEDGTSIILVASLSILAITTVSAYILFRKRKEN